MRAPVQHHAHGEPSSALRRMSAIWRLRSGSGSHSSRSRDSIGVLGLSLTGETLRDTHAVTSVVNARSGSYATMCATAALDATNTAPFVLLEHEGPRNVSANASPPPTVPLAGLHALLYVLRGVAIVAHSRAAEGKLGAARLRAGEGALVDASCGALLRSVPGEGPFEALRVWVRVGDSAALATRGRRSSETASAELHISRALPDYSVCDTATGAECAHVRVILGDGAPLERAESARAATRTLLVGESGYGQQSMGAPARNVGVYDLRIAARASVRLRVRSSRILVYVREGSLRMGTRVVKKLGLAALHGPFGGTTTLSAEGDEAVSCFVLEGCSAKETLCYNGEGLAASSARALKRLARQKKRSGFGVIADRLDDALDEKTALLRAEAGL